MRYSLIALSALLIALPAYASEVGGTLTTGVSTGVEGTVAATPTASPLPGTFTSAQDVVLSASSADEIRYIIDGSAPTCSTGTVFSDHIDVDSSLTIRAVGCYNGTASSVGIFAYGINLPPAPPAPPAPSGGGGGGSITPPPANATPGDITGDSTVDLLDFNAILVDWGATGPALSSDLNHDGVVDLIDFNILIVNWSV